MIQTQNDTNATRDYWILILLILAALAYRVITTEMIGTGGDSIYKWSLAMRSAELPVPIFKADSHHSARMSVNYVAYAVQQTFGTHPIVYYFPTYLIFVLQVVFVFLFCRRAGGLWPAVLAPILLILHPMMVRHGAQLMSAAYSGAYIMGTLFFLSRCFEPRAGSIAINRTIAALFFFLAYMAKVPNLFFLPALVVGAWAIRRDWRDVVSFLGIIFVLVAVEWVFYVFAQGQFLGRLAIVMRDADSTGEHLHRVLTSGGSSPSLFDLFHRRYSPRRMGGLLPASVIYASVACAIYLICRLRRLDAPGTLVSIALLCFVVVTGAAVKSFDPLIPAQSFNPRYLVVLVPLGMATIVLALLDVAAVLGSRLSPRRGARVIKISVIAVVLIPVLWIFHEQNRSSYVFSVENHPFAVLSDYVATVNGAVASCTPIIFEQRKSEVALTGVLLRRIHRVTGVARRGAKPYSVAFARSCANRYPDLDAYLAEVGDTAEFDAVWVSRNDESGERYWTIKSKPMPVTYLIEHFVSKAPPDG